MCSLLEGSRCPLWDGKAEEVGGRGYRGGRLWALGIKNDAGVSDRVTVGWLGTAWTTRAPIKAHHSGVMGLRGCGRGLSGSLQTLFVATELGIIVFSPPSFLPQKMASLMVQVLRPEPWSPPGCLSSLPSTPHKSPWQIHPVCLQNTASLWLLLASPPPPPFYWVCRPDTSPRGYLDARFCPHPTLLQTPARVIDSAKHNSDPAFSQLSTF